MELNQQIRILNVQDVAHKYYPMSKMIKRADGSYSPRGLWDNIRAARKKGGKKNKPSKEMIKQIKKIKKEE